LVVEFSSPNITGEFQAKHLRSTILGSHIATIYESMGWEVIKVNYLGDWGKPIGLLGVGWEKFGSEELFQANPLLHLRDIHSRINALFLPEQAASKKARDEGQDSAQIESQGLFAERNAYFTKLQDGDGESVAFWKQVREVYIDNYQKFYASLNISFDEYSGESQIGSETMDEVVNILKSKGLCEESGGALIIDLKKHTGKSGTAIIRDRTGSSTYLLRDLAAVFERYKKYSFDKMIYVVAADQHVIHFSRLFKILEIMDMGGLVNKLQHVHFSDVSKLWSGIGNGAGLEDVFSLCQCATSAALKTDNEKAALLGETEGILEQITANTLLVQEFSVKRGNDHGFDMNRLTSFDAGTGLDLQCHYSKLCSILKKNSNSDNPSTEDSAYLLQDDHVDLLRLLAQYPSVTHLAYHTLEPSVILTYLSNLVEQLSSILEANMKEDGVSQAEMNLYQATEYVLANGMRLLGLKYNV
jgi:arginyl-tRNA synthetase